jgi:hypothetical protein
VLFTLRARPHGTGATGIILLIKPSDCQAERGVPMSFVQAVHQSLGPSSPPTLPAPWSAQPLNRGPVEPGCAGPIDRAGEDDATTLEMAGLLAVYADSLRRIAKAEADHYETNIERRLRAKGLDERQLIEIGTQLGDRVIGLLERVLLMVLMFYFREPGTAVLAGLDLVEHGPAVDLPPAHVGIHTGPVISQDGDVYGRTVNLAARIASYAQARQVVVSQETAQRSGDPKVWFDPLGAVELKGVAKPLPLYQAYRRS